MRRVDAAGPGILAVAGTRKALAFGISSLMAPVLGMRTNMGGALVRDVLTAQVPAVPRKEVYARAVLKGAAAVAIGRLSGVPVAMTLLPGAALCLFLRMMAVHRGLNLPLPASSVVTM